MLADSEIKITGYKALVEALGEVQAEKFITLSMRDSFDYPKWQVDLLKDKSVSEISKAAMKHRK